MEGVEGRSLRLSEVGIAGGWEHLWFHDLQCHQRKQQRTFELDFHDCL